ncbi:MAG: amidophosphoribosyltransferase [Cyanobacteria bacterium HKST-UBA03]|nr:amidophosphoribosyltransferase [Cyanobacteria bacterium HKST-UBA03]
MCGIFGVIGTNQAASEIFLALQNLQHRGEDGAGIVIADETGLHKHYGLGLLDIAFPEAQFLELTGNLGVGHTRYGTSGGQSLDHLQPFADEGLQMALAHNGNLVNYHSLARQVDEQANERTNEQTDEQASDGVSPLETSCDSEFFRWYLARYFKQAGQVTVDGLQAALTELSQTVAGSYSVVGFIKGLGLFAFRDPWGLRPLKLGVRKDETTGEMATAFASESTALTYLNFDVCDSVAPGELVVVTNDGQQARRRFAEAHPQHCMFEWVYFARVESQLEDLSVYQARFNLGVALGKTVKAAMDEPPDVIVPIPETSRIAAIAMAESLGIPYREVLIKNRYVNRTFILENQAARLKAIGRKLYPVADAIKGKRVLLVDDSIVRGNTAHRIADMIRACGAKALYLASTCPPIRFPCYYGIDFPLKDELVAGHRDLAEITEALGVDQVIYQSMEGLREALGNKPLCTACLDGNYPTDISDGQLMSAYRSKQRNDDLSTHLTGVAT